MLILKFEDFVLLGYNAVSLGEKLGYFESSRTAHSVTQCHVLEEIILQE